MSNNQTAPMNMDAFRTALKEKGMKATAQRIAVHQAMLVLGHASADQVAGWIDARTSAHISIASVYNILSQMAMLGIYALRYSPDNRMYFDVNPCVHIHLYDSDAGTFSDLKDDELLEYVLNHIHHKRYKGYKPDSVEIQVIAHQTQRKTRS